MSKVLFSEYFVNEFIRKLSSQTLYFYRDLLKSRLEKRWFFKKRSLDYQMLELFEKVMKEKGLK